MYVGQGDIIARNPMTTQNHGDSDDDDGDGDDEVSTSNTSRKGGGRESNGPGNYVGDRSASKSTARRILGGLGFSNKNKNSGKNGSSDTNHDGRSAADTHLENDDYAGIQYECYHYYNYYLFINISFIIILLLH
jgi:hypothetical protein